MRIFHLDNLPQAPELGFVANIASLSLSSLSSRYGGYACRILSMKDDTASSATSDTVHPPHPAPERTLDQLSGRPADGRDDRLPVSRLPYAPASRASLVRRSSSGHEHSNSVEQLVCDSFMRAPRSYSVLSGSSSEDAE